jgi:hypothetical protein
VDGNRIVLIMAGDERTGSATCTPSNRRKKGYRTEAAVAANLRLFDDAGDTVYSITGPKAQAPVVGLVGDMFGPDDQPEFWCFLVYHRDDEIVFELSLPASIHNGYIREWRDRIIFDPLAIDSTPKTRTDDEPHDDHEVEVKRRAE